MQKIDKPSSRQRNSSKDESEDIEKLAKVIKAVIGVAVPVGVGAGFVATFIYCFFLAHFRPSGLQVGDTFFFLFVLLGFSLTAVILDFVGFLLWIPWINRPDRKPSSIWTREKVALLVMPVAALVATLLLRTCLREQLSEQADASPGLWWIALAIWIVFTLVVHALVVGKIKLRPLPMGTVQPLITETLKPAWPAALFIVLMGLSTVLLDEWFGAVTFILGITLGGSILALVVDLMDQPAPSKLADTSRTRTMLGFVVLAICVPYLFCGLQSQMFDSVMGQLGIYAADAMIVVNAENAAKLEAAATSTGATLYRCQNDDGTIAVSHVRIWWHGAGTKSFVEILPGTGPTSPGVRVELDSAGVSRTDARSTSCIELKRGIYFDSNRYQQNEVQRSVAFITLRQFMKLRKPEDGVLITGHADEMPRNTGSNIELARARACAIYSILANNPLQDGRSLVPSGALVYVDSVGDADRIAKCESEDGSEARKACDERNRRVDVRLFKLTTVKNFTVGIDATLACSTQH
jgi:flagellar motor protein MotB